MPKVCHGRSIWTKHQDDHIFTKVFQVATSIQAIELIPACSQLFIVNLFPTGRTQWTIALPDIIALEEHSTLHDERLPSLGELDPTDPIPPGRISTHSKMKASSLEFDAAGHARKTANPKKAPKITKPTRRDRAPPSLSVPGYSWPNDAYGDAYGYPSLDSGLAEYGDYYGGSPGEGSFGGLAYMDAAAFEAMGATSTTVAQPPDSDTLHLLQDPVSTGSFEREKSCGLALCACGLVCARVVRFDKKKVKGVCALKSVAPLPRRAWCSLRR
jgi:hypothetical protein